MYQLYFYPKNASLAPHFLLKHMQLEHQLILVDRKSLAQKSSEYLKLNPTGRIPTLIDGDLTLFESSAICLYLCENNPHSQLTPPAQTKERALCYQWLAYLNNTLQAELMMYFYPEKHTENVEDIKAILTAQEHRLKEIVTLLEQHLSDREFFLGKTISVCDFFFFMLALWSSSLPCAPLSFPALNRYLKRMARLPAIQQVCSLEGIDLSEYRSL